MIKKKYNLSKNYSINKKPKLKSYRVEKLESIQKKTETKNGKRQRQNIRTC